MPSHKFTRSLHQTITCCLMQNCYIVAQVINNADFADIFGKTTRPSSYDE